MYANNMCAQMHNKSPPRTKTAYNKASFEYKAEPQRQPKWHQPHANLRSTRTLLQRLNKSTTASSWPSSLWFVMTCEAAFPHLMVVIPAEPWQFLSTGLPAGLTRRIVRPFADGRTLARWLWVNINNLF